MSAISLLTLRIATPDDKSAITSCAELAYKHYVERIGCKPAPMVADFAAAITNGQVRVAESDGQLLGYAIVESRCDELHLENIGLYRHLGYLETDRRNDDGFDRIYFEKTVDALGGMSAPR